MKKSEKALPVICGFLFGVVVGFLLSPIKKGFEIGNNCGNCTNYYDKKEEETEEEITEE
ncbi:hypothetical protein H0486_01285 [Lachnospiraceae bacterium MD1]|jgi:hypothetical protein|uniref:Uncharacterized protein n=1 Tax=Variimorphobacter saccharofermentans TaxID=2755051 RepID=A0A839JW92_9FIRM|nr:hypothetical protein [Variimorphobacter saccharofermentans]MBB2181527.1 hypothetical protein [Variimorphobacter saccharofermentans]